jgi:hypothetical protein
MEVIIQSGPVCYLSLPTFQQTDPLAPSFDNLSFVKAARPAQEFLTTRTRTIRTIQKNSMVVIHQHYQLCQAIPIPVE